MVPRLNISDLHYVISQKKQKKMEVYEKIISNCHKRIQSAADLQHYQCVFEVPEFILGYPLYNLENCLEFLMNELKKNGFNVTYYFPKFLYISWHKEEKEVEIETDYKAFQKVKPIVPKNNALVSSIVNRKGNGKLTVSLV
jgi:hypothetical protein